VRDRVERARALQRADPRHVIDGERQATRARSDAFHDATAAILGRPVQSFRRISSPNTCHAAAHQSPGSSVHPSRTRSTEEIRTPRG